VTSPAPSADDALYGFWPKGQVHEVFLAVWGPATPGRWVSDPSGGSNDRFTGDQIGLRNDH
jgi:hypothetical protein